MKKINLLLFVILLFATITANAQNFSIFEKSKNYFFQKDTEVYAIKADSVVNMPTSDTVFYFFPMFWEEPMNTQNCLDFYGGTLFGKKSILSTDSSFIFITKTSDSVMLKPYAIVGDSWIAYRWKNQDLLLKATISNQSQQSVGGVLDEVKTITFTVQNISNQDVLINPFHGKELLLSESSGLLNTFDFYHFPTDTLFYSSVDVIPTVDYAKITLKKIFDFNIGDIFHVIERNVNYDGNYQIFNGLEQNMMKKVVSKTTYTPDTAITYSFERCSVVHNYVNYIKDTTYIYDTISVTYSYENFADNALFSMPFQTFQVVENWYNAKIIHQSLSNNQMIYSYLDRVDAMMTDTCWKYICVDPGPAETTYMQGLGGPYYYSSGWWFPPSNSIKLVYYKKGETTWGTPIAPNCLSLINDVQELKPSVFEVNVYPNPAMNKVFVELQNFNSSNATLEIFSLEGKMLQQQTVATNSISEIDIQSLPSGMFVLKIRDKDHSVVKLLNKMK